MSKQQERQNAVRLLTGTAYTYSDDWHALFDADGIAEGPYNERLRTWINGILGTSYQNVNDAMRMFAIDQGFTRWAEMGDFVVGARITLSATSIAEDEASGSVVGALEVINGSGVYTFSITADPDSKFAIDGTNLETAAALDYETATFHSVTIEADNGVDTPVSRTFTIFVTDVDDTAPTITSANSGTVVENETLSFALTANESVTWSSTGGADAADFEISGSTLRWAANTTRDFENPADADTNNAYVVQVTATDAASNATNQTITITVTDDATEAPPAGPTGNGILLEDGASFLLAENSDYLILEQ
jgi:hypothetical protein